MQIYNGKEINIMFTLTKNQYEELVGVISKYCCPCDYRHGHCAEIECDVQMICEILYDHMERTDIKPEEKLNTEWSRGESDISCDEDKLPFKI